MNIAFYVNNVNDDRASDIFKCLNEAIKNQKVDDASLFFNNPGPNPHVGNFGMFNSTELWAYTGMLINTHPQSAIYSLGVVNKFKPYFLFSKGRHDIMALIYLSGKMPILVTNQEDEREIYRLTGKKPKVVELNAESLKEVYNE
jgi:hypothetical protein